jgi:tetratricopeptide (TPR) repeat protein
MYSQIGNPKKALEYFAKLSNWTSIPTTIKADLYVNIGIAHTQQGDLEAAENSFKKSIALNSLLGEPYFNLANIFEQKKAY